MCDSSCHELYTGRFVRLTKILAQPRSVIRRAPLHSRRGVVCRRLPIVSRGAAGHPPIMSGQHRPKANSAGSNSYFVPQNSQVTAMRAVLGALGDLLGREAREHLGDPLARAGAVVADRDRREDAHAALVEQAVEQPLDRNRRVDQFVSSIVPTSACASTQASSSSNARHPRSPSGASPPGRSAWRMRSGASGRNCTTRPPARQRWRSAAALAHMHLGDGEADAGRDLLRLAEIGVRDLLEAVAFERDDALVAAGVAPWSMVMASVPLAEERRRAGAHRASAAATRSASKRA